MRRIHESAFSADDVNSHEAIVVVDDAGNPIVGYGRDESFTMPPFDEDEATLLGDRLKGD